MQLSADRIKTVEAYKKRRPSHIRVRDGVSGAGNAPDIGT